MNIVFTDNKFLVTPLGEWPKKPAIDIDCAVHIEGKRCSNEFDDIMCCNDKYRTAHTAALSQSTPIVEEDYEKVKEMISSGPCEKCWGDAYVRMISNPSKSQADHYHELLEERKDNPCPKLVDGTVYKDTGCELVAIEQFREKGTTEWIIWEKDIAGYDKVPKIYEYRRAYRVKETKI